MVQAVLLWHEVSARSLEPTVRPGCSLERLLVVLVTSPHGPGSNIIAAGFLVGNSRQMQQSINKWIV